MVKNSPSINILLKIVHILQIDIRVFDINNLKIFNHVKDEIYSLLENETDKELILYRNIIKTIKDNQILTAKQKNSIIQHTKLQIKSSKTPLNLYKMMGMYSKERHEKLPYFL